MANAFASSSEPSNANPRHPSLSQLPSQGHARRLSATLFLAALVIGGIVKLLGPGWAQTVFSAVKLDGAGAVLALLAAGVVSIVLHECGHLLAALLVGFDVLAICLGPVRAVHSYGKWRLEYSGRLMTGSISAIPRTSNHWRDRVLMIVSGGPVITLLLACVASFSVLYGPFHGWPKTFLGAMAQLNVFLFVLGLIPNARTARVRNDARLFAIFWEDSAQAREIFLFHLLTRLEVDGVRPRDYPIALMRASSGMEGRPDAMLLYSHFVILWALDRGDLSTAFFWDDRALELSQRAGPALRHVVFARSACIDVLYRGAFTAAGEKFFDVDLDSISPAWFRHRCKAAYALINRNISAALAEICQAQQAFPARLPLFEFERSLLILLHRQVLEGARPRDIIAA